MIKILKIILKIIGLGKIKTKDDLTNLLANIVLLIGVILNQYFGITIPEEYGLTVTTLLVALILRFWNPATNKIK